MSEYAFLIVALCVSLASSQRPFLTLGTLFYLLHKGIIPQLNIPQDFLVTTTEPWIFIIFATAIFEVIDDKLRLFGNIFVSILRPFASMAAIYTVLWFESPLVNLGVAAAFGIIFTLPVMRIYAEIFVSAKLRAGDQAKHDLATGASLSRVRATNTLLLSTIVDLVTIFFVYFAFKSGLTILIAQIICLSAALHYQYVLTNRVTQEVLKRIMATPNPTRGSLQPRSTPSPYQLAMLRIQEQEKAEAARLAASTDADSATDSTSAETPSTDSDAPANNIVVAFKPFLNSTETPSADSVDTNNPVSADEDDLIPLTDSPAIRLTPLSSTDTQEKELPTFNDNEIIPADYNPLDATAQDETREHDSHNETEPNAEPLFEVDESSIIGLSSQVNGNPVSNASEASAKPAKNGKPKRLLKRTLKKVKKQG